MSTFNVAPKKTVIFPFYTPAGLPANIRVGSNVPVNVYVLNSSEREKYLAGVTVASASASLGRQDHEISMIMMHTPWFLAIENEDDRPAEGSFFVAMPSYSPFGSTGPAAPVATGMMMPFGVNGTRTR